MTITKNTIIGDILDTDGTTAPYFMEMGMHCLMVHGVDPDELVSKLNEHLQGK